MINEKVMEKEPRCVKCGKNEFELMRTLDSQITAICVSCGEPYVLDSIDQSTGKPTSLTFWSPKMGEERTETPSAVYEREEIQYAPIPQEWKEKSVEDIAKGMIEFLDKEYPELLEGARARCPEVSQLLYPYWRKMGVDTFSLSSDAADFRVKLQRAELIVQKEFAERALGKRKQRILDLKHKLVEWARKNELWKLTQVDVEEFLLTSETDLARDDGRLLAKMANADLRKMQRDQKETVEEQK